MKTPKLLLSLLFIITLGACSPNRYSCPSTRGMSGYSLRQAVIDNKKQMYDTVVMDLSVKEIAGYSYIGNSNVVFYDGEKVIQDKAGSFFYRNQILFPKCAVKWCTNVSAYSYLDGSNCCCDNHSEN